MRPAHCPRGFYQRDGLTDQVVLRIRPQRGPGAGCTIVMQNAPNMMGAGIRATVDGRVFITLPLAFGFAICYRHLLGRLARDQRVNNGMA